MVRLEGESRLYWRYSAKVQGGESFSFVGRTKQPRGSRRSGFFEAFLKLADAAPQEIQSYAMRWGVLDPCGHGLCGHEQCARRDNGPVPKGAGFEPLSLWRELAGEARALVRAARDLRAGVRMDAEDRAILGRVARSGDFPASVSGEREMVAAVISWWARAFGVRPVLSWAGAAGDAFECVTLQGATLPGALAAELLLAVTAQSQLTRCDACGRMFAPMRRARIDRRSYCRECGHAAAVRTAKADARVRARAARDLLRAGAKPPAVAEVVGMRVATARAIAKRLPRPTRQSVTPKSVI